MATPSAFADRPRATSQTLVFALVLGLLILLLASHALLGWYSRYMADDYCTVGTLHRLGFGGSQVFWYTTWSGRYTFTFLVNLAEAAGTWIARVLPAAAVIGFVLAAAYAVHHGARSVGLTPGRVASAAVGAGLVFAVLDGAPSIYQSLYWQTGMITYALPLVLLSLLVGWLLKKSYDDPRPHSSWPLLGVGVFTAIAGGLSETHAVLQAALLGAGLVLNLLAPGARNRRGLSGAMLAGLLGSIVALTLLYFAPGTAIRRAMVVDPMGIEELVTRTLADGRLFVARTVKAIPAPLALAVLLPAAAVLKFRSGNGSGTENVPAPRKLLPWLILIPPATAVFVLASMTPYEYAVGDYPDARVLITGVFVLAAGMAAWGFVLGLALPTRSPRKAGKAALALGVVSLVLVAVSAPSVVRKVQAQLPDSMSFARDWDRRDVALRDAARRNLDLVAAASLPHIGGLAEIGNDPNEWINRCVAQAYGLKDVVAK